MSVREVQSETLCMQLSRGEVMGIEMMVVGGNNREEKTNSFGKKKKKVKERIHRIRLLTNLKQLLDVYVNRTTHLQWQHVLIGAQNLPPPSSVLGQ